MKQLGLAVLCFAILGCSKESEKKAEVSTPAKRAIVEVKPDLPRQVEEPAKVERAEFEKKLPEAPRNKDDEIGETEARLEKEREWAIELETANNERMAKKLGVSAEEFKNLTIEEQKELIRKRRGRK